MDHAERINAALRYIENHLGDAVDLDSLARQAALSRFHFDRIFRALVGQSPMKYLLRRRLALSIDKLSNTSLRVLDIALHCGFNSHESFDRAFRREFGLTPSALRHGVAPPETQPRVMVGPLDTKLSDGRVVPDPPIVDLPKCTIGAYRYHGRDTQAIGRVWDLFWQYASESDPFRDRSEFFGVCRHDVESDGEHGFDYYAGAVLHGDRNVPKGMTMTTLPSSSYFLFSHRGGPSTIGNTYEKIYGWWLPRADQIPSAAYDVLRVDSRFRGADDAGTLEILVPVCV